MKLCRLAAWSAALVPRSYPRRSPRIARWPRAMSATGSTPELSDEDLRQVVDDAVAWAHINGLVCAAAGLRAPAPPYACTFPGMQLLDVMHSAYARASLRPPDVPCLTPHPPLASLQYRRAPRQLHHAPARARRCSSAQLLAAAFPRPPRAPLAPRKRGPTPGRAPAGGQARRRRRHRAGCARALLTLSRPLPARRV